MNLIELEQQKVMVYIDCLEKVTLHAAKNEDYVLGKIVEDCLNEIQKIMSRQNEEIERTKG